MVGFLMKFTQIFTDFILEDCIIGLKKVGTTLKFK